MATNKIVHGNNESYFMFAQEATFGTAIADGGTYIKLEAPIPEPDYGVWRDMDMKNAGSRVLEESHDYVTQDGQIRTIPVNDIIVRQDDLGELLYSVCQNVSEGAGAPYQKDFLIAGAAGTATTQPDFASNAGYFATLGIYDPIASNHRKFTSCIGRNITLSANTLTGDDARMRASLELISGFASSQTANFTGGTYAFNTQSYFNWFRPTTASIGGSDIMLYGFSLTISNNAYRVGLTSAGACETYALPSYSVTGSITTKWDATTDGLIAAMIAGTSQAIILRTGVDGDDGECAFTMAACELTGTPKDYGGEYGQAITIEFTAKADSSTGSLLLAEVCDGVDQAW